VNIDLIELNALIGARLAEYGVVGIDAIPDIADGVEGTVYRFRVNPEFWGVITRAGDYEYPRRLLAMYAEALIAVQQLQTTAWPLMSEPVALATQVSWAFDAQPYDLLERVQMRELEGQAFLSVPAFPRDDIDALSEIGSADEVDGGAADDVAEKMDASPSGEWALQVLTEFRWFQAEHDTNWFAFVVTPADYDIIDGVGATTAAQVTMYGENMIASHELDETVADLVVVLMTDAAQSVDLVAV